MVTIYTIGHSNHTADTFLALVQRHGIQAVADVRSAPYSHFSPQFNKDLLPKLLQRIDVAYFFMGDQVGARPSDPTCYRNGSVDFSRLSQTASFQAGLAEIRGLASQFNLVLMCSEKDPILCHRMVLVGRHLKAEDTILQHIGENGELEETRDAERRLLALLRMDPTDLFRTPEEIVEEAYDRQGARISYREEEGVPASMGVSHT